MTRNEGMLIDKIERFVNSVVTTYPEVTFKTVIDEDSYGYDVLLISLYTSNKTIGYDIQVNLYDPESYGSEDRLIRFDSSLKTYIKDEIEDLLK